MKQLFRNSFLVFFILSSALVFGQVSSESAPGSMPSLKKVGSMQDNFLLSLGFTDWLDVPNGVETETFSSREFGVMIMTERMIPSGILGFAFGLGFTSQNVHSNAIVTDSEDGLKTELNIIPNSIKYDLNKISLNFIDGQIEIRVHTKPNQKEKRFKVNAGLKGGILLQSHAKFKNDSSTVKESGIKNLNKYQYGLTARIGFGKIALGGYYSLVGIFKEDKGPDLVPYSASIYLTL